MARKTTLIKLLDDLRIEARLSTNPAHNVDDRLRQIGMLQRTQERLWEDFTWPHLRVERQHPVQSGQRYYAPPEDMPIDNIEMIEIFTDGGWTRLTPGITSGDLAASNSDLDQRNWPPCKWQMREGEDIELWPVPNKDADVDTREGFIKFTGIRNLKPLVSDSDRCDLDGQMLVLYVAAELLAATGAKDAQLKLDKANSIYARLRGRLTPKKTIKLFGIHDARAPRRFTINQYRRPEN